MRSFDDNNELHKDNYGLFESRSTSKSRTTKPNERPSLLRKRCRLKLKPEILAIQKFWENLSEGVRVHHAHGRDKLNT